MSDESTITKSKLIEMLQAVPDDALIMFLSHQSDIETAVNQTMQHVGKDPSEVVLALEDSVAYEQTRTIFYLVGKAIPLAS